MELEDIIDVHKDFDKEKFKKGLRKSILHLYKHAYTAYIADEEKGSK